MTNTSFEDSSKWYLSCVGQHGHYYHKNIILPKLLALDTYTQRSKILDIACGQGILERALPKEVQYVGLDLSSQLIEQAKKMRKSKHHKFITTDVTKPFPLEEKDFTHAFIILALQNIEEGSSVIKHAATYLKKGGKLVLVLNHPAFRIPRQSSWEVDEEKKMQYRKMQLYMSPLKIPIYTHPSKQGKSQVTFSFHQPISTYVNWLSDNGFMINRMEELVSDKKSTGKMAKMENRARKEFPLFMTIVSERIT